MPAMNTGNFPRLVIPGLRKVAGLVRDRYESQIPQRFNMDVSRRAYEESLTLAGFGTIPIKEQGQDAQEVSMTQGFYKKVGHRVRGAVYTFTMELKRQDLYGIFSGNANQPSTAFVESFFETKEIDAATIYNTGSSTTNFTVGDGLAWFSGSHLLEKGGTASNLLTGAAFSYTSAQSAINMLDHTVDGDGKLMNKKLRCFVFPSQGRFLARQIIESAYQPGGNNNDVNGLVAEGLVHRSWPYLTNESAWFGQTAIEQCDLTMFTAQELRFETQGAFRSQNTEVLGVEEYSFFINDWRGTVYNPGS